MTSEGTTGMGVVPCMGASHSGERYCGKHSRYAGLVRQNVRQDFDNRNHAKSRNRIPGTRSAYLRRRFPPVHPAVHRNDIDFQAVLP